MTPNPKIKIKKRFLPGVESLDPRLLLSGATAHLSRGVLTVTRTDSTQHLQIDVRPLTVKGFGARAHARPGGTVVVQGVGSFPARRIRSIAINPGWTTDNITVHEPARRAIPYRVQGTIGIPLALNPPPAPAGSTASLSSLEKQVFDLVNSMRTRAGVAPLTINTKLLTAARIHANDMAALDIMDHTLPGVAHPTLISRAQFVGYRYGYLGENIAAYYPDAPSVVSAWAGSSGHRSNILNPHLTETGIGIGVDSRGALFFCQDFGSPGPA